MLMRNQGDMSGAAASSADAGNLEAQNQVNDNYIMAIEAKLKILDKL